MKGLEMVRWNDCFRSLHRPLVEMVFGIAFRDLTLAHYY